MKRLFDICISLLIIVVLAPVLVTVFIFAFVKMGRPIFFRQMRPGIHGKPFYLIKLRSMTNERDATGKLLPNDVRLTSFGKILRATSLDELPSLFNVLMGDMSLVGPRPLRMEYLKLYNPTQNRRHEVKPGITGWAQVNGRNLIDWDKKFEYDVWYVENRSIRLDFKILVLTVFKVFKREGIDSSEERFVEPFKGADIHD